MEHLKAHQQLRPRLGVPSLWWLHLQVLWLLFLVEMVLRLSRQVQRPRLACPLAEVLLLWILLPLESAHPPQRPALSLLAH
jgi:hypothetical protein